MSQAKTERLMNLIFALLATRQYLTKEQIRDSVAGYKGSSDDAFDRMFERDKEELRELGIPIEMGTHDKYFTHDSGYRIRRDEAELPDVELTGEEAAVIGLATQVWEHAGLAGQSTSVLVKLKSIGIEVDTDMVRMAEPRLSADEPCFDDMWEAVTRRIPVAFVYRRAGGEPAERHVQPWGILSWHGRWYMGGFDLDRDAPRLFRLERVVGEVTHEGEPGSYEIPEGTDMRRIAQALFPPEPVEAAVVRVRKGRGQGLRRIAESVTPVDDDTDELHVRYHSVWGLGAEIASYGPDAVAVSPQAVRDATAARLRAALEDAS